MPTSENRLPKRQHNVCPGCRTQFWSTPGDQQWCTKCRRIAGSVTVDLNAAEMQKLKSQATIRGCTIDQVIRLAIDEFANRRGNGRPDS